MTTRDIKGVRRGNNGSSEETGDPPQYFIDFELAARPSLNLVCFRHTGGDEMNQELVDSLNDSGDLFLTHTVLDDQLTLRFSIGQTSTRLDNVERAWAAIQGTAAELA